MNVDIPHMIATIAVFLVILLVLRRTSLAQASKGKRFLVTALVLFVALMILNAVWPPANP